MWTILVFNKTKHVFTLHVAEVKGKTRKLGYVLTESTSFENIAKFVLETGNKVLEIRVIS